MTVTVQANSLRRVAFTIECYLDHLGLPDGPQRTRIESSLVNWLAQQNPRQAFIVSNHAGIYCYSSSRSGVVKSFSLSGHQTQLTLWTNGHKIKSINSQAYQNGAAIIGQNTIELSNISSQSNNNNNNNG